MLSRTLSAVATVFLACAIPSPASAQGAGQFRLGLVTGLGMYEQGDVNDALNDIEQDLEEIDDSGIFDEFDYSVDELTGGVFLGVRSEYLVTDNWGIGAELLLPSNDGGYDVQFSAEYDSTWGAYDEDLTAGAKLLSAYGLYRMPMGEGPLALRAGAGLCYAFGAELEYDASGYQESWDRFRDEYHAGFKASGSGFGFHGSVGAEYQVGTQFLLVAELIFRAVEIGELEVDDVSGDAVEWEDFEEGDPLRWDDAWGWTTEHGSEVGLDFGGIYFTLGAFYCF